MHYTVHSTNVLSLKVIMETCSKATQYTQIVSLLFTHHLVQNIHYCSHLQSAPFNIKIYSFCVVTFLVHSLYKYTWFERQQLDRLPTTTGRRSHRQLLHVVFVIFIIPK
ncbi:hypothetical protein NP493_14g05025 [Ridgeia piscesae]|uniref:Uncharacterized protein n=1 Tax=Ridgeia piscesae TaxID=27915 RepID=A0AAD9UKS7_RIDPI|nr:hypothetical protein NP493_14g05025 [Ridgeia piscesae]